MGLKFGTVANEGKLRELVLKNVPFRLQKRLKMRTETYALLGPGCFILVRSALRLMRSQDTEAQY